MANKQWYKSKTVWAATAGWAVTLVSAIMGETSQLVAVLVAVTSALGIYGRAKATGPLK